MKDRLHAIVYVSSAVHLPTVDELEHLLKRARERNLESAVTGLLLYGGGNFMQYIEGPHAALLHVYRIIQADPLHTGLIELMDDPVPTREFGGWSLAYRVTEMPDFIALSAARWRQQGGQALTPGKALLRKVWAGPLGDKR